jgi:hypothetical protein
MQTKLDLPYKEHLAFQECNDVKMTLNDTFGFNEYYTKLKSINTNKTDLDIEKLQTSCIDSLDKIFNKILDQTNSVREKLFVEDLYDKSSRILKEDFSVFTKRSEVEHTFVEKTDKNFNDLYQSFAKQKFIKGKISKKTVEIINKNIKNLVEEFRNNAKNGRTTRDDLSVNNGNVVRSIKNLLNKEFSKDCTLDILYRYMGAKIKVIGLAIELSVPNSNWWKVNHSVYDRQPSTTYFHFDESLANPKAILYLSDVTERNGATSCAPNFVENAKMSQLHFLIGRAIICVGRQDNPDLHKYYNHKYHQVFGCPVFKNDFSRLPEELQFSSHFGWDVIPDSPLEKFLIKDEIKIIGEAGTYIAFDGGELPHRGGLLLESERVALQIVFGEEKPLYKKVINKIKTVLKIKDK